MKLYIDKDIDLIDLDTAMDSLSPQRREAVSKMGHPGVRRQSIAAYLLLCRALREEYGIARPPSFAYEDGGKPFLADGPETDAGSDPHRPNIHFNFSHCKRAVVCAVSDCPVGVDVETVHPFKDVLARHVLSQEEYDSVTAAPRPDLAFIEIWTRKEAVLKLTGEGIRTDLKTVLPREDIDIKTVIDGELVYSVAEWTKHRPSSCVQSLSIT